jgi:hypothetical protein
MLCRWWNRKRVKKRIVLVAYVQSATSTNRQQRRSSSFCTILKKSRRRRRRQWSFLFYLFLCLSLSKFQHVFTQFDTPRARPHFVKSFVYIACLTTIINVHCPNGTSSLGFFLVARKVTVIGQKVNFFSWFTYARSWIIYARMIGRLQNKSMNVTNRIVYCIIKKKRRALSSTLLQ